MVPKNPIVNTDDPLEKAGGHSGYFNDYFSKKNDIFTQLAILMKA